MLAAVRLVVEKERLHGQIQATSTDAAALPTGFVTLLMTDIEASTALLRRLGDRYGDLLNDVRGILRNAVLRASGREIDARADEFFAVFERTAAAIEAATAIQRALGLRAWPDDLKVRVRVGIHSGRPTLTDVGYIGLAVHTTARVCAAAHGGQIVVSGETRAVVGKSAPTGIRFRSLGRHRLPGLPDAQTLFQVQAKGLPASFPRPRAARRSAPRRPTRSPATREAVSEEGRHVALSRLLRYPVGRPMRAFLYTIIAAGCLAGAGWAQGGPGTPPPREPDVRYEPSEMDVVQVMLQLGDVKAGDVVYDLGCGDGRIVIAAARQAGARGVCVDIDPQRIAESRENARRAGVTEAIEFLNQDLLATDLSRATVVMLFLSRELNLRVRPKLLRELRPGTRVVSHWHDMGDWPPQKSVLVTSGGRGRHVYLWTIPNP